MISLDNLLENSRVCDVLADERPRHFKNGSSAIPLSFPYGEKEFRRTLLMAARHLRFPDVRLIKNEEILDETTVTTLAKTENHGATRRIDVEKIWSEFENGATINIIAIHNLHEQLFDLATALSEESGDNVIMNAYFTPLASQGFGLHFDTHDVLIIQLQGQKQWSLAAPTIHRPLSKHHHWDFEAPKLLSQTLILQPGDVLYLPRGTWHAAKTLNESSLHLTVGFYCRTFVDLINDAVALLTDDERVRARSGSCESDQETVRALAAELRLVVEHHLKQPAGANSDFRL